MSIIVFLSIAGSCALFFLLTLVFGGHGDADTSDMDGGDVHGHDHDGDDGQSPSIFSLRSILLFGVGFGSVGALTAKFGGTIVLSCVLGILSGVGLAAIGWFIFRTLYRQQASTTTDTTSLVGKQAFVNEAIPPGGIGQVRATNIYGQAIYLSATCEDSSGVKEGTGVTITQAHGAQVVVRKH